jgi:hypothetical protein
MKIKARLPVYVRGLPAKNNGPRDIFVSRDVPWEIPEISRSETELAFRGVKAFRSVQDENDPLFRFRGYEGIAHRVEAISYDGDLYRRISHAGEDINSLFSIAFAPGFIGDPEHGVGSDISLLNQGTSTMRGYNRLDDRIVRPISLPVYKHMYWQLRANSTKDAMVQSQEVWPQSFPAAQGGNGLHGARNTVTFEDILPKLLSYDHEQLEDCAKTHKKHLSSFLLVDGHLWMKTRPPVYKVHHRSQASVITATSTTVIATSSAMVTVVFPPDWQDPRLPNAYFSLASRNEAFDYAGRLLDAAPERKRDDNPHTERWQVVDLTGRHVVHDETIMNYDCEAEELRRMSSGLAIETRRFLERNPNWKAKFDVSAVTGVQSAYEEVMATNYICGDYGDPSDWMQSTARIWKKAGRKNSIYDFGDVPTSDLLIDRAMRYEESRPIALRTINSNMPGL